MKRLAIEVWYKDTKVGTCEVCTSKFLHVIGHGGNMRRSNTADEEVECAIAGACFARNDWKYDGMPYDSFTLKGVAIDC